MIKARYVGVDSGSLQSGRVYKISTRCTESKLIVSARNEKRSYPCLEVFLKDWKVEAVYREKSRKKKSGESRKKESSNV